MSAKGVSVQEVVFAQGEGYLPGGVCPGVCA